MVNYFILLWIAECRLGIAAFNPIHKYLHGVCCAIHEKRISFRRGFVLERNDAPLKIRFSSFFPPRPICTVVLHFSNHIRYFFH